MYNKLKELRQKHNLTGQEVSDMLHISKSFYWQIENGQRTLTYDMAVRIADIFKRKPDYIFYKDTKKQSNS